MAVEQQRYLEKTGDLSRENLYSLGVSGIPFLGKGESFLVSDLAREKLSNKVGDFDRERGKKQLISNIVFLEESGEWVNGSWVVSIGNFDREILTVLGEPKTTCLRFLDVDGEVAELMGSTKMVEIGFNVGGGEIVFKRILLPESYTQIVDEFLAESLVYVGTKMPDVFADAWRLLNIGAVDEEWDKRVIDELMGNDRDMSKRIEYWFENGEKYLNWGGEKMWAGLLSDKRDINRYLVEESNAAGLKTGEYWVTKYSHGDGGAVSAGTAGDFEELAEPQVVADVQMMGPNGEILQAAVEGPADKIDQLAQELIKKMRQELGLELEIEQVLNKEIQWENLPIVPISVYPMKEWLILETGGEQNPNDATSQLDFSETYAAEFAKETIVWSVAEMPNEQFTFTDTTGFEKEIGDDDGGGLVDIMDDPGVDDSGGDEPDDRQPNDPGGGGLVVTQMQTVTPSFKVIEATREIPAELDLANETTTVTQTQDNTVAPIASETEVSQEYSVVIEKESLERMEGVSEATTATQVQSEAVAPEQAVTQTEIPMWEEQKKVQTLEIPEWDMMTMFEQVNFNLSIPMLQAEEWGVEAATMAFNAGKWGEFDQLNYWNWAMLTMHFAIVNTSLEQLVASADDGRKRIELNRGSGPQW